MTHILKEMNEELYFFEKGVFIIPLPFQENRVIIKIIDTRSRIYSPMYIIIDAVVGERGTNHYWNTYNNKVDHFKISLNQGNDEREFLIEFPEYIELITIFI